MRIDGEWLACDDGIVRPIILGEVLAANGFWEPVEFLLDIGADRTVFSSAVLSLLGLPHLPGEQALGGLGGRTESVLLETTLRLTTDHGTKITLRGQYAAVTSPESLDFSVLGRDVTRLFAVIVDQPGNVVCLLGQRHRYRIESV
jgi:hypothetical protein